MLFIIFSTLILLFVGLCIAQVAIILWENRK